MHGLVPRPPSFYFSFSFLFTIIHRSRRPAKKKQFHRSSVPMYYNCEHKLKVKTGRPGNEGNYAYIHLHDCTEILSTERLCIAQCIVAVYLQFSMVV